MENYFKNKIFTIDEGIFLIRANNRSLLTFYGTNTYIVGKKKVIIIDPGPNDPEHYKNIMKIISDKPVSHILITHSHSDHTSLAKKISKITNAKIYGYGRRIENRSNFIKKIIKEKKVSFNKNEFFLKPDYLLEHKQIIQLEDLNLEIIYTPGHLTDHLCIAIKEKDLIFSGDHVMGWSTSIIIPPDGNINQYYKSLEKLIKRPEKLYFPGHGQPILNGIKISKQYLKHKLYREQEILNLFFGKKKLTIDEITTNIYKELDIKLYNFAKQNVLSHLISLIENEIIDFEKDISMSSTYYLKK